MDNKQLAAEILKLAGGKENVSANAACMTRLRISVRDMKQVDFAGLKQLDGVLGVVQQDTVQVVLGPGKVNRVMDEFAKLTGLAAGSEAAEVSDLAAENKAVQKQKHNKPVQQFLKRIANIFIPLLPGIIAAGLINGLTNVINVSTEGALSGIWWYEVIRTLGWALFAYLPLLVGANAAKEFGGSQVLGAIAGALFIAWPAMPLLSLFGEEPVIIPIIDEVFSPARGGLLAALIAGIFFAFLEKNIRKIMPGVLDTFFTPLLTVIVGGLVAVVFLQPVGYWLTSGIFTALEFVYETMGVVGGYILSATFLPLVAVGLHHALTPIHALFNNPEGPTAGINYLLPILMMAGGGQVGAGLALYVKSKNKNLRRLIRGALPVGVLGIGEPLMYAITLPLGKSFITACLGAGIGGVVASLFNLGTISQGVSGLFGLLIISPGFPQVQYVIAMLCAYAGGFLLTWFFAVDKKRIAEVYGE
ncbi:MAG: PTS transporter subunit EIIC [Oscillospiraceae bacterium]|nr:PTS transporter subunit EIIC [Oscillospiraceae bacterium]